MGQTQRARLQTEERIERGVAVLRDEVRRQAGLIRDRAATINDLDLRALYLALDERARRFVAQRNEDGERDE